MHLAGSSASKTHCWLCPILFFMPEKGEIISRLTPTRLANFFEFEFFFFFYTLIWYRYRTFSRRVNCDMRKNALYVHIIYTACACTTRFSNLFLCASQFYSHNAIVYSIALYIHSHSGDIKDI